MKKIAFNRHKAAKPAYTIPLALIVCSLIAAFSLTATAGAPHGQWVTAEKLETGDRLLLADDKTAVIKEIALVLSNDQVPEKGVLLEQVDGYGQVSSGIPKTPYACPPKPLKERGRRNIPELTYNFSVEDYSTYFVSKSGVWGHNTCPPESGPPFSVADLDGLPPTGSSIDRVIQYLKKLGFEEFLDTPISIAHHGHRKTGKDRQVADRLHRLELPNSGGTIVIPQGRGRLTKSQRTLTYTDLLRIIADKGDREAVVALETMAAPLQNPTGLAKIPKIWQTDRGFIEDLLNNRGFVCTGKVKLVSPSPYLPPELRVRWKSPELDVWLPIPDGRRYTTEQRSKLIRIFNKAVGRYINQNP
jgi:hypothetical protein